MCSGWFYFGWVCYGRLCWRDHQNSIPFPDKKGPNPLRPSFSATYHKSGKIWNQPGKTLNTSVVHWNYRDEPDTLGPLHHQVEKFLKNLRVNLLPSFKLRIQAGHAMWNGFFRNARDFGFQNWFTWKGVKTNAFNGFFSQFLFSRPSPRIGRWLFLYKKNAIGN